MLKKIVISLVLTIPFISCSDNENRRFYTKAWTINLGDYL